jgi:hypothetical protein
MGVMVAKQRETPNRLMEHRSRQAGWMVVPDNAEEAASDVVADAFGAILAAFAEERAEPPKALVKLLERTRAGITKELCRLIKTWRPETTTAGKVRRGAAPGVAAERAAKLITLRINIMRSRSKKHRLTPCGNSSIDIEFELLSETINDNIGDLFKGWKS